MTELCNHCKKEMKFELILYFNAKSDIDFDYEVFDIDKSATFESLKELIRIYNAYDFIIRRCEDDGVRD